MKKNVVFNTAIGSLNIGDYIINESAKAELSEILKGSFVIELPTHTPATHVYQNFKRNKLIEYTESADYKFIIGTNLLSFNALGRWPSFNVNLFNKRPYVGSILVGVGSSPNANRINKYTELLYRQVLSSKFIHSVRDENTKIALENIGIRAINTGCVTMWGFTPEKCALIPKKKADRVVFTLTDYDQDREKDQELIDTLRRNYTEVFFWPQGSDDYKYIRSLDYEKVSILEPQLESYRSLLLQGDIDFVGTRLHAGIFAMQHNVRSIILIVDNRARDIQQNYNINAIERNNISEELEPKINSLFVTSVLINQESIDRWKSQFID